ncbi:hypothetical protein DFH06DRAFT_1144016 [Mycena polygramma]|nr:hypothetical protein DFH06DRAFT_1144016 [Mycena polygramma]
MGEDLRPVTTLNNDVLACEVKHKILCKKYRNLTGCSVGRILSHSHGHLIPGDRGDRSSRAPLGARKVPDIGTTACSSSTSLFIDRNSRLYYAPSHLSKVNWKAGIPFNSDMFELPSSTSLRRFDMAWFPGAHFSSRLSLPNLYTSLQVHRKYPASIYAEAILLNDSKAWTEKPPGSTLLFADVATQQCPAIEDIEISRSKPRNDLVHLREMITARPQVWAECDSSQRAVAGCRKDGCAGWVCANICGRISGLATSTASAVYTRWRAARTFVRKCKARWARAEAATSQGEWRRFRAILLSERKLKTEDTAAQCLDASVRSQCASSVWHPPIVIVLGNTEQSCSVPSSDTRRTPSSMISLPWAACAMRKGGGSGKNIKTDGPDAVHKGINEREKQEEGWPYPEFQDNVADVMRTRRGDSCFRGRDGVWCDRESEERQKCTELCQCWTVRGGFFAGCCVHKELGVEEAKPLGAGDAGAVVTLHGQHCRKWKKKERRAHLIRIIQREANNTSSRFGVRPRAAMERNEFLWLNKGFLWATLICHSKSRGKSERFGTVDSGFGRFPRNKWHKRQSRDLPRASARRLLFTV